MIARPLKPFFQYYNYRTFALETLRSVVLSFRSDYGAFYVFARGRLYNSWNTWKHELPSVRPYYAVKCNPDRAILQTLSKLGAGFDCASGRELMEVAEAGASTEDFHQRVVYANPCKPLRDLYKAKALGSPTTVIDSCEEVEKLKDIKWGGGALLRLLVEDKGSIMPFSRKFGISSNKVEEIAIAAAKAGIPIKGVSFHVGSGCQDEKQYKMAISAAADAISVVKGKGHEADIVDIGGGFMTDEHSFEKSALAIRMGMVETSYTHPELRYIAEPGRFFATSAFDLFVQVIGKKPSIDGSSWRYTIDESLYGQFSCIPFDHKKPAWLRVSMSGEKTERKRIKGTLFGRTCDSLDLIATSDDMEELEVGDWLWFPNMGAYSSVTASEFNGFPKPPTHGLDYVSYIPEINEVKTTKSGEWPRNVQTVSCVNAPLV